MTKASTIAAAAIAALSATTGYAATETGTPGPDAFFLTSEDDTFTGWLGDDTLIVDSLSIGHNYVDLFTGNDQIIFGAGSGITRKDLTFTFLDHYKGVLSWDITVGTLGSIMLFEHTNMPDGLLDAMMFADGTVLTRDELGLPVPPVPLPAAGWLLAAGLGTLALSKRKRA